MFISKNNYYRFHTLIQLFYILLTFLFKLYINNKSIWSIVTMNSIFSITFSHKMPYSVLSHSFTSKWMYISNRLSTLLEELCHVFYKRRLCRIINIQLLVILQYLQTYSILKVTRKNITKDFILHQIFYIIRERSSRHDAP